MWRSGENRLSSPLGQVRAEAHRGSSRVPGRNLARRGNVPPVEERDKGQFGARRRCSRCALVGARRYTCVSASRRGSMLRVRAVTLEEASRLETYLPTQYPQAFEDPWFSPSNADARRESRASGPPGPRPEASLGLIWRVRDRGTFEAFARAPRHRVGPVSLRFSGGESVDPPRVAYAIGRRVGSAVERNRIRRRMRASVAACVDDLAPGGAYLFGAERAVLTLGFADLCEAVARLVRRASEPRS